MDDSEKKKLYDEMIGENIDSLVISAKADVDTLIKKIEAIMNEYMASENPLGFDGKITVLGRVMNYLVVTHYHKVANSYIQAASNTIKKIKDELNGK